VERRKTREEDVHLKKMIYATAAAATLIAGQVAAQPGWVPPGNDPDGYYSDNDHNGYYGRDGRYHRMRGMDRGYRGDYGPPPPPPPPPAPAAYYQQGRYEADCRRGNATAGTIFGALAGGLIGGAASRGNGGAVVGGVVLGGLLGNVIGRDIDCEDQPIAYRVYGDSLNGDIGRPYEWNSRGNRGSFTSVREFRRGGMVCRDFTTTTYRRGERFTRSGTACRDIGTGNWRFD
jgi:surface antigen